MNKRQKLVNDVLLSHGVCEDVISVIDAYCWSDYYDEDWKIHKSLSKKMFLCIADMKNVFELYLVWKNIWRKSYDQLGIFVQTAEEKAMYFYCHEVI